MILVAGLLICIAAVLYYEYKPYPLDYLPDGSLLVDPAKMRGDAYEGVGFIASFVICRILEKRQLDFDRISQKLRLFIGIFALIPVYKTYGGLATFILSSLCFFTDFIDGFLARTWKTSTFFGSLFDALSDKAFLVINMLLLMSISPYAIILVIFELLIALIQSIKYNVGLNIKSNIYGKIKMWVAGIVISVSYLLTDNKFSSALNLKKFDNKTFLIIFIPLFLAELVTLISYIKEYFKDKVNLTDKKIKERKKEDDKTLNSMENVSFKDIMFKHSYYELYKDYGNLKLLKSLTKKV